MKKKLRAFNSIDEFFNVTGFKIGDVIVIRRSGLCPFAERSMLTGFRRVYTDEEFHKYLLFGSNARSLDELFNEFKYYKNGDWLYFGVKE